MQKLVISVALLCGTAQGQSVMYSGQDLYTRLTSNPPIANGYIAGVHDSQSGITICVPPNTVTLGQMSDMVKLLLERAPSERHLPADIFIQAALSDRWPCKKKGGAI